MTKKMRASILAVAVVVLATVLFSGAFYYLNEAKGRKDLKNMAEWPPIRSAVTAFFTHYNDEDYTYLYQVMVSDEQKAKVSQENFERNIKDIRAKTGKVRDAKLFSSTFKEKTSSLTKESTASYVLGYFTMCEKADSICRMLIVYTNKTWHIDDFSIQYNVSQKVRKQIEGYISNQLKLEL